MIVKPSGAAAAFRKLDQVRIVLTYGPDEALARELADKAVAASGIDAKDPFSAVSLGAESLAADPARLADEALAHAFLGGRKLIIAQGLTDACAGAIDSLLALPEVGNLVIGTAGDLPKKSKLRALVESNPEAVAIICYADARGAAQLLNEEAGERGLELDRDAAALLLSVTGSERGVLHQEIEKLDLYAGDVRRVDLDMVKAIATGAAQGSYDGLLKAVFDRDPRGLDAALAEALANGEAMVAILRAAQRRCLQLMRVRLGVAEGQSVADAVRQVQPPIFWKEQDSVSAQARALTYSALEADLADLLDAEVALKSGAGDGAGSVALIRIARRR
jgi:DNA polymerase III subunit delta